MGVIAPPIMFISLTFLGVLGKYGLNVDGRSPVKTVFKKVHPMKSYGQNKKIRKNGHFWAISFVNYSPQI